MPVGPADVKAHHTNQFTEVNDILEAREVNFALILCAVIMEKAFYSLYVMFFLIYFFWDLNNYNFTVA